MPSSDFVSTDLVYQFYLSSASETDMAKQCFEQCHGFGNSGDCKSAIFGYQIPTPEGYYGSAGGALETGCLMFKEYLGPGNFVSAPNGQYRNITAANISCP
jgi:hypothetical protein